jgi:hypothetical protein
MKIKSEIEKLSIILLILLGGSYVLYLVEINDLLLMYEIFIDIPLILLLGGSIVVFVKLLILATKQKRLPNKFIVLGTLVIIILFLLTYGVRNGAFYGEKIIDSAFLDDRSRIDLTLYENGKYIIFSNWLFGEERFQGTYKIKGDTIYFDNYPLKNNFIAKKIVINKKEKKIYFKKNKNGKYDRSFYYFQIDY